MLLEFLHPQFQKRGRFKMGKKLIASLLLSAFASTAMAADPTPAVQISRDANYIYVKQPWRVTMDAEQQATLKQGVAFVSGQLKQFNETRAVSDPNGDLKGLADA